MRTPTALERERAEGEGAFLGRSIASEKKVRRPVKRERLKTIASRVFFVPIFENTTKLLQI